ncbi:MAG TPA: RloB family protein, partial [Acetobacteraceae bacterium]|nr:RloB family protein [Acetobacteraceae bacterium]
CAEAKRATRRRGGTDSYEERDKIWAVFDRDQHLRYEEAIDLCRRHNVDVARSNPCFELWLILHETDYDKPDGGHAVQRHLRTLRPEYDPHGTKTVDCADLINRIAAAEQRSAAQLIRREQDGTPFGNPSTTVGNLIRAILDAAKGGTP